MTDQESKSKKKRPRDLNLLAFAIVTEVTEPEGVLAPEEEEAKNPHAVELGRLGGRKGGKARAEKLTPEQRKEIAKKAAQARWKKKQSNKND